MARQERPLRDFAVLLYGAGLGFLTNLATNSADGWAPPFTLIRDHSEFLIGAGVLVPAGYYAWRQRKLRTEHDWDAGKNPYPGLQAFDQERESVFFGREGAKRELHERLDVSGGAPEDRFLLVAGPSGSGKSSLVNAGLVVELRKRRWNLTAPVTLNRDPFGSLVHELQGELPRSDADALVRDLRVEGRRALERLRRTDDPRSEHPEVINAVFRELVGGNRPAALLLDQAEELVTQVDAQTRQEFMAVLHTALADHKRLHVVATMRAEFIDAFLPEPSGTLLRDAYFVTRLNRAELRQIITGPARKAGVEIEPDAVAAMVDDATEAGADVLPLLAHLLRNLYEDYASDGRITLQEYVNSGRVEQAISSTADKVLARLSRQHDEEKVLRTLLRFVSWASHAEDPTRNRVRRDDLDTDEKHIVDEFLEARLLVDDSNGQRDLAHEALLRQWVPLRTRLEEQRPLLRQRTVFEQRAEEWAQADRRADLLLPGSQVDEAEKLVNAIECSDLLREFTAASAESRRKDRRDRAIAAAGQIDQIKESNPVLALAAAREIAELSPDVGTAAVLWARLRDPLVWSARRHAERILDVRWDDDGRMWVVDASGTVMVHDIAQEQPVLIKRVPAAGYVDEAVWTQARGLVFNDRDSLKLWDVETDEVRVLEQPGSSRLGGLVAENGWLAYHTSDAVVLRAPGAVESVAVPVDPGEVDLIAVSSEGLLAVGGDGAVRVWDPGAAELTTVHEHVGELESLSWSPSGRLASCHALAVRVWDSRTGRTDVVLRGWNHALLGASWADDEQLVIGVQTGQSDSVVQLWNSASEQHRTLRYCADDVRGVFPAPDGRLLSCNPDGNLELVRADLGHHTERWQEAPVTAGAVHGSSILALGADGRLRREVADRSEQLGEELHLGDADLLAWSPGGLLASARWDISDHCEVRVLDPRSAEVWTAFRGVGMISDFAWSVDGILAVATGEVVCAWDGAARIAMEFVARVVAIAWSPSGLLAAASSSGELRVWDPVSSAQRVVQSKEARTTGVRSVAWSPHGVLAFGDEAGAVRTWDPRSGEVQLLAVHTGEVEVVAWSPDGVLASGGDQTVRVYPAGTGGGRVVEQQDEALASLAWSPTGALASGWHGGAVRLWDPETDDSRVLHEHQIQAASLAWSADGRLASCQGTLVSPALIWDPGDEESTRRTADAVRGIAWSPSGELTTFYYDDRIRLWDSDFQQNREIVMHGGPVEGAAITRTGRLASFGLDGDIRVWDEPTGECSHVVSVGNRYVRALAWGPHDRLTLSWNDGGVSAWDPGTSEFAELTDQIPPVDTMAWNDRGVLATGGDDFVVRLWEPDSGRVRELRKHTAAVRALLWLDDERLVSGGEDGLLVWDTSAGTVLTTGDAVQIQKLAWLPDGRLASADREGRIRLWDLDSGHVITTLSAHDGDVTVLGWRDDGVLVSAGLDRAVRTWGVDTDVERLLREADERGVRRLTEQERARFGLI
ncbi:AAA family ATPase [Saccharopolyspora indica]|uniref:nSTAND1 domain-containing NTPase n=1 Tax=Saccharopolyspora indica TaxID=1229659 RepID=UPI0022EA931A|nr:AAA family ATPase [Saccharopolyspora indica]MDA3643851.1 AAA family ATPase [Saccharopolyspora indica]